MKKLIVIVILIPVIIISARSQTVISFVGGYSTFALDNFKLKVDQLKYLFDPLNDTYQSDWQGDFRIGMHVKEYFLKDKSFALGFGYSYQNRNAELHSKPKYRARHQTTNEIITLVTNSTIRTNFSSSIFDISGYLRFWRTKTLSMYLSLGFVGGVATERDDAEFKEEIIGEMNNGNVVPTSFLFRENNSTSFSFKNKDDSSFAEATQGVRFHYGAQLGIGVEWFFADQFGVRCEIIERFEPSGYFKNSTGTFITTELMFGFLISL
ncbi:MAG: hypothetical protein HW421_2513 [Ignavibacteria bacterium]|nr:hypothetical protein [Ignavibacteria bacterium]